MAPIDCINTNRKPNLEDHETLIIYYKILRLSFWISSKRALSLYPEYRNSNSFSYKQLLLLSLRDLIRLYSSSSKRTKKIPKTAIIIPIHASMAYF